MKTSIKLAPSILGLLIALTSCATDGTAPASAGPADEAQATDSISDEELARFLTLADLPTGQEEPGMMAARDYCTMLDNGGSVKGGGFIFDAYPELQGFSGRSLITAAITVYCPQHTSQIALLS